MLRQYSVFLINGVMITLVAWGLQYGFYRAMGIDSSLYYGLATAAATLITLVINFYIQKRFIFKKPGILHRYIIVDLLNMLLVSVLAPIFRLLVAALVNQHWGDKGGFLIAAFLSSIPVFLLKRFWVFR